MKKPLLNNSQKNSLRVSLRMLEKKILTIEMLIENKALHGEFVTVQLKLEF